MSRNAYQDVMDSMVDTFDEMIGCLKVTNVKSTGKGDKKNEFGEKVNQITDPHDWRMVTLVKICKDCQINPLDDNPKIDRLNIGSLEDINDGDHYVVKVWGGANGGGGDKKWQDYLMLVRKLIAAIGEKFKTPVWLVDWKNDCLDDVWDLRLGFEDGTEKFEKIDSCIPVAKAIRDAVAEAGKTDTIRMLKEYIEGI